MIQIKVNAGKGAEKQVHELCETLRHARVWAVSDRRYTKHLHLTHSSGNVKGRVKRVESADPEILTFDCTARSGVQEAITAGRFVNLVLRDMSSVSDISIHRR